MPGQALPPSLPARAPGTHPRCRPPAPPVVEHPKGGLRRPRRATHPSCGTDSTAQVDANVSHAPQQQPSARARREPRCLVEGKQRWLLISWTLKRTRSSPRSAALRRRPMRPPDGRGRRCAADEPGRGRRTPARYRLRCVTSGTAASNASSPAPRTRRGLRQAEVHRQRHQNVFSPRTRRYRNPDDIALQSGHGASLPQRPRATCTRKRNDRRRRTALDGGIFLEPGQGAGRNHIVHDPANELIRQAARPHSRRYFERRAYAAFRAKCDFRSAASKAERAQAHHAQRHAELEHGRPVTMPW